MDIITVTFPAEITMEKFKYLLEHGMRQCSEFNSNVTVKFVKFENGENVYNISAETPMEFFQLGMIASNILTVIAKKSRVGK